MAGGPPGSMAGVGSGLDLPPALAARSIPDRVLVVLASAVWAAASGVPPVPLAIVGALVVGALGAGHRSFGRSLALTVLLVVVVSTLAARAESGLRVPDGVPVAGRATLVSDPEWFGGALRVDLSLAGRRYEVWLRGSPAYRVEDMLAGESVVVSGRTDAIEGPERAWSRPRHIGARLVVENLTDPRRAGGLFGPANSLRRLLARGAAHLGRRDRVLLAGFTVGDDRGQDPLVTDDFRASGLTHLIAVSGQNVAFVLLLVGPLLRRLGPRTGVLLTGLVLVEFALVTRWEPSVLRAAALAMIVVVGSTRGARPGSLRALALAVTVLLIVDPLLVWSVGFQLSVAASLGMILLSGPVTRFLPGPRFLAEPLGVTVGAQVAVSPLLVGYFGTVPLVSVPANLLAVPVAGPLMVWGLTAGPLAGMVGGTTARILHLPTRLMIAWVAGVAREAAAVRAPVLDSGALVVAGLTGGIGWLALRWWLGAAGGRGPIAGPGGRGVVLVAVALTTGLLWSAAPLGWRGHPSPVVRPTKGMEIWRSASAVVLVVDRPRPGGVLTALRRERIGRVDVLVARSRSATTEEAVDLVSARASVAHVLGPEGLDPRSLQPETITAPVRVSVGGLSVSIDPRDGRLDVTVERAGGTESGAVVDPGH